MEWLEINFQFSSNTWGNPLFGAAKNSELWLVAFQYSRRQLFT
tara:strand:+ start:341 stop:469 length:129 start_codon:yes stop_codon:yes gene_type:complete